MCLDTVEGDRPTSSVIWHTQSSPPERAMSILIRFWSESAFAIVMKLRMRWSPYMHTYRIVAEALDPGQEENAGGVTAAMTTAGDQ